MAAFLIPACGGGGGAPPPPPGNGTGQGNFGPDFAGVVTPDVAFAADKNVDGIHELFVADVQGTTIRNLSGPIVDGGNVWEYFWSPDRTAIALDAEKDTDGVHEVYAVPSIGGSPVKICPSLVIGQMAHAPIWSPNSSFVAYRSNQDDPAVFGIYVSSPSAPIGNVRVSAVPTVAPAGASAQRWSPDSLLVAYSGIHDTAGAQELFVVSRTGTGLLKVSHTPAPSGRAIDEFSWSPDGTKLAYVARDPGFSGDLYVVGVNGSGRVNVSGSVSAGALAGPYWAPDGSRLAFVTSNEVFTCLPDGSGVVSLSGVFALGPVWIQWAPNSSRLAWMLPDGVYSSLPGGGGAIKVSDTIVPYRHFSWAPDSSRLAFHGTAPGGTSGVFTSLPASVGATLISAALPAGRASNGFAWSNNSTMIVYSADQDTDDYFEVYVASPDGSGFIKVSGAPAIGASSSGGHRWKVDDSRIIYQADQDADSIYELYSSLPNGTGNLKITGILPPFGDVFSFRER